MSILLISYDAAATGIEQASVLTIVEEYSHIRLDRGSYAIETDEKTRTVFNKIIPCLSANVHLLVVTLNRPFAAPVVGPVSAWLTKHLPED